MAWSSGSIAACSASIASTTATRSGCSATRAQYWPHGVIFGLVVDQQELLEQLPPQRGLQQLAGVVVPQARDPADLHELPAQRVVHREHHAHVELEFHGSSLIRA